MNGHNIPKRNKTMKSTSAKKSQSQQQTTKQQKRKTALKKCISTQCSTTTLAKSSSQLKLSKQHKKKKDKQVQVQKQRQKQRSRSRQKTIVKNKVGKKKVLKNKQNDIDNCQKTLKKFLKKKKQIEEELTERKKIHMEYFMYKDVCLPIQNTQQRKIIFKIQLIDQNVQRKNKFKKCDQSRYNNNNNQTRKSVEVLKKDTACQKTDRKLEITDYECQTEQVAEVLQQNRNSGDTQQQPQKCFAQTLSQLQFLYLPDQKNFQNFTRSQKAHYKQLLLYMAKKFEQPQQILDQSTIESMLHDRYLKQRGVMQSYPKKGIPTHTSAVISYVSNLFCFMEIHDKTNFIDRLNCSYGYSMFQKLARVKAQRSTKMNSQLISQTTFWKFQAELHDGLQFQDQAVEKALHSHNRAIFDAVNQALLEFQPYFSSQGQPFPWSYNFQTTFYCISQSSYGALVCQVKDKIWQQCTTLAGILLQLQHEKPYKAHFTRILSIQQQMLQTELKKQNNRVDIDQCRTRVLCEVSDLIELEILKEIVGFFYLC